MSHTLVSYIARESSYCGRRPRPGTAGSHHSTSKQPHTVLLPHCWTDTAVSHCDNHDKYQNTRFLTISSTIVQDEDAALLLPVSGPEDRGSSVVYAGDSGGGAAAGAHGSVPGPPWLLCHSLCDLGERGGQDHGRGVGGAQHGVLQPGLLLHLSQSGCCVDILLHSPDDWSHCRQTQDDAAQPHLRLLHDHHLRHPPPRLHDLLLWLRLSGSLHSHCSRTDHHHLLVVHCLLCLSSCQEGGNQVNKLSTISL